VWELNLKGWRRTSPVSQGSSHCSLLFLLPVFSCGVIDNLDTLEGLDRGVQERERERERMGGFNQAHMKSAGLLRIGTCAIHIILEHSHPGVFVYEIRGLI